MRFLGDSWGSGDLTANNDNSLNAINSGYLDAVSSVVPEASSFFATAGNVVTAISQALTTLAMTDAQRRLLNIQLERAKQGLPALDSSQYGLGVSVGLGGDTQKMLLYGIVGVTALMVLPRLMKR